MFISIWLLISFDINSHVRAKDSPISADKNSPSATCSPANNDNGSVTCSSDSDSEGGFHHVDGGDPEDDAHVDDGDIQHDDESPKSLRDFMKVFNRLGTSWSHVFGSYMDVVKTAHGKDLGGDVYADDIESGVAMLQNMVKQVMQDAGGNEMK